MLTSENDPLGTDETRELITSIMKEGGEEALVSMFMSTISDLTKTYRAYKELKEDLDPSHLFSDNAKAQGGTALNLIRAIRYDTELDFKLTVISILFVYMEERHEQHMRSGLSSRSVVRDQPAEDGTESTVWPFGGKGKGT
jgi:hypothetical protein